MKHKFHFLVLCVIFISAFIYSQDVPDWVWKSPMTKVYPSGEYQNLPPAPDQFKYQNPNTTTRVINEGGQTFVLPPNVRPFPHSNNQSEVDADNMGGNTQVIYASWNSFVPVFSGTGFCLSTNGGVSWTGSSVMIPYPTCQGDPGPWVYPTGSSWPGRLGISYIAGAAYSSDNGATWVGHVPYTGGSSFDKNLSDVDDISGSPFFGRAYTVWTYFSTNRIYISYTTNGGTSWSGGAVVSPVPPGGHHHQGCDVEVGPGGTVYVIWANCLTSGQNSTEDFLGFARSTDGGVSWVGVTDNAVDINGIRASNLFNGIRANGFPRIAVDHTGGSRNGWIYVTLAEKFIAPATDVADVTLCRSTNNGVSWTHTRVNQDTPANGRYQYFPDADVAPDGSVVISYYDQRNTTGFVTQYWLSRSVDGGNTWVDVAVSDHNFTPAPIPGLAGGYQGDYTGITTAAGKVWPFWADNSSGIYQVWTDGITVGGGGGNTYYSSNWCPANTYPSLPSATFYECSAWIGDTLYVQTPTTTGTPANTVLRYTLGGTWTTGVPLPVTRTGSTLTSAGGKLYCIGGSSVGVTTGSTDIYEYTPSTGTWTLRAPMPASLSGHSAHNWGDSVVFVVCGPWTGGTGVYAYRIGSNTWITSTTFTGSARRSQSGGISGNKIFIAGGFPFTKTFYIGTIGSNASTITWAAGPDVPTGAPITGLSRVGGVAMDGAFYVVCGERGAVTGNSDSVHVWSINTNVWIRSISGKPGGGVSNMWAAVTAKKVNDTVKIFLPGGYSGTAGITNFDVIGCGPSIPVGISNNNNQIPEVYTLSQNYPNPFNPTTTIKFGLPKAANVKLVIYDIVGREVNVLVNEFKPVGNYTVNFDGSSLASGVYFYKITAGSFTDVKKMVLIK